MAPLKLLLCLSFIHAALAGESRSQVECTPEIMKVTVPMDGDIKDVFMEHLKGYKVCQPEMENGNAIFLFDLQDFEKCAVTRYYNKISGHKWFFHKVVIEYASGHLEKEAVKCQFSGKQRISRDVRPFPLDDFDEPDVLTITRYEEGQAEIPVLGAVVKQNGKQVSGEISVSPGTPLSMEIFLNEKSAPVYGLLANYMHATDTGSQQETIILNGCSVDPYLFENFVTSDGDVLTGKFRAFKFPDSTYVQFRATVTVCLDKCQGVQCSNGVTGYGRRRRDISGEGRNMYEVSLTTFIKVDYEDGDTNAKDVVAPIKNLRVESQKLGEHNGTTATVAEQTDHKHIPHLDQPSKANHATFSAVLVCLAVAVLRW